MRKYVKVILGLMIALCCAGVLTACASDTEIVGKWKVSSVTVRDKAYQVGDTAEGLNITADMLVLELKADKTFSMKLTAQPGNTTESSGTWEKKGDTAYRLNAQGVTMDAAYKRGVLSIDAGLNGYIIYHLTK